MQKVECLTKASLSKLKNRTTEALSKFQKMEETMGIKAVKTEKQYISFPKFRPFLYFYSRHFFESEWEVVFDDEIREGELDNFWDSTWVISAMLISPAYLDYWGVIDLRTQAQKHA